MQNSITLLKILLFAAFNYYLTLFLVRCILVYFGSQVIENARDLLLSGEVNVTEAARLSGFEDIYVELKVKVHDTTRLYILSDYIFL